LSKSTIPAADEILDGLEQAIAVNRVHRDLRLTDKIRDNLRLDSLALMEVLTRVEEHFAVELIDRPEFYSSVTTVGDLVALIQDVLASQQ
jgi:acyl carrier protein